MFKDRFDILLGVLLLACVITIGSLLIGGGSLATQQGLTVDKAIEQELAYQAKVNFLDQLYAPVSDLQSLGKPEAALLKLDELSRRYPNEAHGELLRGEILLQLQAVPQALIHLSRAVRMNGDYVDQFSILSRRPLFERLLTEQLALFKAKTTTQSSSTLRVALQNLYYLQGRMAGGCE